MKTFNNELIVHRGETFTIDKTIQNKDGSPYIISSELQNPYFLLTVSTTQYEQDKRYLVNYWLDLSEAKRFKSTQAFDLMSLKAGEDSDEPMYPNGFDSITARVSSVDNGEIDCIAYGWLDGNFVCLDYTDCVFFVEYSDGHKEYKYWDDTPLGDQKRVGWVNYKCKIVKLFTQQETREWVEQSYVYSIRLVAGQLMTDYLQSLCATNNIDYTGLTKEEMYTLLVGAGQTFSKNFNIDRVIGDYDVVKPILTPTKLSVLSDINGGL